MCMCCCIHEYVKRQWCFIGRRLWEHRIRADCACSDEVLGSRVSDPEVENSEEARTQRKSHAGRRRSRP